MSQYNQEIIVDLINNMYPEIDTSLVKFVKLRDNITLVHPEHGVIKRTPESILKSSSINFNGVRIKAKEIPILPKKTYKDKETSSLERKAINAIEKFILKLGFTSDDYIKNYNLEGTPYIISFYFPSLNYGVNFNTTKTIHSSSGLFVDPKILKYCKDKRYNYNLWKSFHDAGITIFNIYDFYWLLPEKRDIILSKISHGLGKDKTVYARKCRIGIDEVSITDSKAFLNENHLEGEGFYYKNSKVFSLHDKDTDELLMVAVVGQYFEQGSKDKFVNKLGRIATKRGITVVGGLSKLTKEIIKEYGDFHYLITLSSGGSSLNHSDGHRIIEPRYFWVDLSDPKLPYYHRNYTQKKVLEKHFGKPLFDVTDSNGNTRQCTEKEYMHSLGCVLVFDNGLAEIFFGKDHIGSGVKDE